MSLFELFILAVGLSMDAFAVSICKGLAIKDINIRNAGIVGLYFGLFQAGMPLIGYTLGIKFQSDISAIDHWIAFALLSIIGGNMIKESFNQKCDVASSSLNYKNMLALAVATSIDALAVGVTFAFLRVDILPAVGLIGVVTFAFSMIGVKIGHVFGSKFKSKAELVGGIILIFMGIKILFQHLGIFV